MLTSILTIYFKELLETFRDKRTLLFMVLLPTAMMPLILTLGTNFVNKAEKKASSETITYAIFGADKLPELAAVFATTPGFEKVELASLDEIKDAIKNKQISLALGIPATADQMLANGEQIMVDVYYDNASLVSKVKRRAREIISNFGEKQRNARLTALGVNGTIAREQLLQPFDLRDRGVASKREVLGSAAGGMLPYMFIIFCFLGCLYPAIDLGAGEKERGTLETLLLVPVPRYQVVLGKFFAIFTCGVISSTLSIGSMAIWLYTKAEKMPPEVSEVLQSIGLMDILMVISMLIPIAAMFASLLLSISIFARSFKEAMAYATPLNIVIILPAMLALLPGVELDWTWAMVPITNVSLAVKELVKGTMDYTMFIAIFGSSTVIAGGLLFFCTQWFERESVLFRE